uniref:Uncharacterized protein n=1 Tax=Sander lucioperca TaxID=283035 RepID=A0A8D0DHG4_SANLU
IYPTPVYWHAGRGGFREVYEPAEDSFLLVDAQEKDTDRLQLMTSGTAECLLPCLKEVARYRGCLGRGREVTNRFLPVVAQLLSSKGLFYLITIAENDPGDIVMFPFLTRGDYPCTGQMWLRGESCSSTRAGNERLSVLKTERILREPVQRTF